MPYLCQCRCPPHWGFWPLGPFSRRWGMGPVCHSQPLANWCQQCWWLSSPFLVSTFNFLTMMLCKILPVIKREFCEIAGFPNVIGATDCTHVHLKPPSTNDYAFINCKNYHFMNVRVICNPRLSLLNVVALQQSRSADSTMHKYAATEHCIRLLKCRWLCLGSAGGTLLYTPEKVCNIILACWVLHNIAQDNIWCPVAARWTYTQRAVASRAPAGGCPKETAPQSSLLKCKVLNT